MKQLILGATIVGLLTSCVGSDGRSVPLFPTGGGDKLAPPYHGMIDDPEAKTESWSEKVVANSQAEANERCQKNADKYTREGKTRVSFIRAKRIKGNLYECDYQSEVE